MAYWIPIISGLALGCIPVFFYIKQVLERERLGYSTPYSRAKNADLFGNDAEHRVYEALKDTFDDMCGPDGYFLSKGSLILTHAPGMPVPTCEIDHLIICRFGIFVVETKGWRGKILPGSSNNSVIIKFNGGKQESRRSPIAQCASKVAFIRRCQPLDWRVEAVAVFAHPDARLASGLPENTILLKDIPDYFEAKHAEQMVNRMRYVDIDLALGVTYAHRDWRPNASALHSAAIARAN